MPDKSRRGVPSVAADPAPGSPARFQFKVMTEFFRYPDCDGNDRRGQG